MRIATKEYKVYRYNELSKEAMENVDRWYLETYHTTEDFSTMVRDTLDYIYELEDLNEYVNVWKYVSYILAVELMERL